MKRRDVLKLGALAAVATQLPLDVGCVVPRATTPPAPPPDDFLALLDRQLAAVHDADFVHQFVRRDTGAEVAPAQHAMLENKDALFRKMLRTLIITQGFREQTPQTQLAPAVQARMFDHMDEVGSTIYEVSDLLASLDDRQRVNLKHTLKARPDLPMAIAESIDAHAARAGISSARRLQLRQMMASATFRLRNGDPRSMIDEYVAKVERVRESAGTDAAALKLAEQMGEHAFWTYQQHLAQMAPGAAGVPATAAPPRPAPTPIPPQTPTPAMAPSKPGSGAMHAGGYMMGIGVVTFGVSIALVGTSFGFVIGATVGALLFAIGFVTLIVGALMGAGT